MAFSEKSKSCENGGKSGGNSYVFKDEDFTTLFKTQEGSLKVMKKFSEKSHLFNVIQNYRMLILEANPLTFLTPSHWDSDIIFFVGQGKGTVSLIFPDRRESYKIEKGHLMTLPAGILFYMTNSDEHEKLVLSMFLSSINNSGEFAPFFGAGGQDPESFLNAFSTEILETAFNTSSDRLQRIFSQQRKGVIVKASKEQIRALTADVESSNSKEEFGPCQILDYLRESNDCGNLFMVLYTQYKKLEDFNLFISFCVLTKGCMNSPFHSSRATKVIMVTNGGGHFEMTAFSQGEEGSTGSHYKKISTELCPGTVLVVPPGHPMVLRASQNENLESICFEINAKGNQKCTLAGKVNMMKLFHNVAKELTFAISAEEVDEVLDSQRQDFFMRGPK